MCLACWPIRFVLLSHAWRSNLGHITLVAGNEWQTRSVQHENLRLMLFRYFFIYRPDLLDLMSWRRVRMGARGPEDSIPPYVPIGGFMRSSVYWDPYSFTVFLYVIHPSHSGAASASLSLHSSIERHVREPWLRHADQAGYTGLRVVF